MAIDYTQYIPCKLRGKEIENLRIHKTEDKYLFDFRHNGSRYRKIFIPPIKDTRANNIARAKIALAEFKEEKDTTVKNNQTVNDVYNSIYSSLTTSEKSKSTFLGTYTNRIQPFIGRLKIIQVKPTHISTILDSAYKIDRISKEAILDKDGKKIVSSPRVKKQIHEALTSIFKYAINNELIARNPIKPHHDIKRNYGEEKTIIIDAQAKYRAVYDAIHKLFKEKPKLRALYLFGFHGRRRNEVLTLKWTDVSEDTYVIRAENSKVKRDLQFTLPTDIKTALFELYPYRDSEYIFSSNLKPSVPLTNITYYSQKIIEETGIEDFSFHYMRNLAVSALSSHGVDTTHLSAMLGHTDASTLKKYLSLQLQASSAHTLDVSRRLLR